MNPLNPKSLNPQSIFPRGPRQSAEVTGVWVIGVSLVINSPNLTWQQVVAIGALCLLGHAAATKENRRQ